MSFAPLDAALKAATERSRSSSALNAVTSVSRPRRFSAPWCAPAWGPAPDARAGRRRPARARSLVLLSFERPVERACRPAGLSPSSPKRFLATSSALRLVSSSCRRRSSSSRLRASAASRSARSMASRASRMRASSSAILRSSASRSRASPSACARAAALLLGQGGQHHAGRLRRIGRCAAGAGAAAALPATPRRLPGAGRSRGGDFDLGLVLPGTRLLTFSTTTALVRPWLKLWRTTPARAARFQRQRLGRGDAQLLFASLFCRFSHSGSRSSGFQHGSRDRRDRPGAGPIVQGARRAPETPDFRARQAALHVSHLIVRVPNPIART